MKQYKGYYIDHVYFNSEKDIDEFVKNLAIEGYKTFCRAFSIRPTQEAAIVLCEKEDDLHRQFGMSYAEIEDIQIAVFASL